MLYRYRPINAWLEPVLKADELFFSAKAGLNDPFDLDVHLSVEIDPAKVRSAFESAKSAREALTESGFAGSFSFSRSFLPYLVGDLPHIHGDSAEQYLAWYQATIASGAFVSKREVVERDLGRMTEKIGICCFSRSGDDALMFSHYADGHRGCCLEFDEAYTDDSFATVFPALASLERREVEYREEPPLLRYFEASLFEVLRVAYFTKHVRWSYEQEVRFVRFAGAGSEKFRREALRSITFGCASTDNDIQKVLDWLGPDRHVEVRKAIKHGAALKVVPL